MNYRDELISYISDGYKDAYGIRPRHINFSDMSVSALESMADSISGAVSAAIAYEKEREQASLNALEEQIDLFMSYGASCRENALEWILDANGLANETDSSYICYNLGLPYYCRKFFDSIK